MDLTLGGLVKTLIPGHLLLGTRLGNWYSKNPYHLFDEGDILILRERRIFGYGIRPVALVEGYEIGDFGFGEEGKYIVTMHRDVDFVKEYSERGNVVDNRWWAHNEIPAGVERAADSERHFKWNIEHQFKRVDATTVEDAVALYASRTIDHGT